MRCGSVSPGVRSALRPLLPLPQLPAADRKRVRHYLLIETDRVELLAGDPVPVDVPRGAETTQRIFRCPTCQVAIFSRYTRASVRFVRGGTLDDPSSISPGRAHLHALEAALGDASRLRSSVLDLLRPAEALAGHEPRAHRGAWKAAIRRMSSAHCRERERRDSNPRPPA